jgi:hypothetical protein
MMMLTTVVMMMLMMQQGARAWTSCQAAMWLPLPLLQTAAPPPRPAPTAISSSSSSSSSSSGSSGSWQLPKSPRLFLAQGALAKPCNTNMRKDAKRFASPRHGD